jgi:Flp pilus assembly protein TadB
VAPDVGRISPTITERFSRGDYRTLRIVRQFGPTIRSADRPAVRWRVEWVVWLTWLAALVAGGIAVAIGGNVGSDLLAIAMIGMFGSAVWNAWVLISEVAP